MKKIAAFAGSTSKTSINKKLAGFAAQQLQNTTFDVLDLNDYEVPMFSEGFEKDNEYPNGAELFNETLDKYDGFIISLAEHNGSYSAAFKNLFDWVSRKNREVFRNKPVLVMATSPGGRGGATVLEAAQGTFPHMGANVTGTYTLPKFYDVFKDDKITDDDKSLELKNTVTEFEQAL
ncbi:NAD(P)H-dependent FMN reductase [Tenacibaculum sp. MAR_2009_124]|uniref:NADPH-dependent FMN reductase n=1 Tax=Tenacibaculum sp. MAR_2009_124 TaxID=1250059 RepID=UPI00089C8041|nr:NAD(P)H-dependent oxidoreductase [Tenacibaculum sp. MAR_2009_124]SEB40300.1 NAD(P)H-dependent FMN reductase [Tenacibaculum sp. MAR_2009_124]